MGYKIWLVLFVFFLMCSSSLLAQDVTLTIGDSSGVLGSHNNVVTVSLDNQDDFVRGLQGSIADEGDILTCTGCSSDPTRAATFICSVNEQPDGICNVVLYTIDPAALILQDNGPVFTIYYSVNGNAPPLGCSILTAQEVYVADDYRQARSLFDDMIYKIIATYSTSSEMYPETFRQRFLDEALRFRQELRSGSHRQVLAQHDSYRPMLRFLDMEPEEVFYELMKSKRESK